MNSEGDPADTRSGREKTLTDGSGNIPAGTKKAGESGAKKERGTDKA